jgi:AhpD family alkylhydroperoxidase
VARVEPLPPAEWPEAMQGAIAALRPAHARHPSPPRDPNRPKGLGVLGMLAHHPQLTGAFHAFTGHVLYGTTLEPRERELLVLRVAAVRDCEYEWAQHVRMAADAGLTADAVARAADGADAPGWSELDAALLRAVDELIADACITDATWAVLAAHLDTKQLMDVIFTVGNYDLLAMALRSFGVALDADLTTTSERD